MLESCYSACSFSHECDPKSVVQQFFLPFLPFLENIVFQQWDHVSQSCAMRVAYLLSKTRSTDMDRPVKCSSVTWGISRSAVSQERPFSQRFSSNNLFFAAIIYILHACTTFVHTKTRSQFVFLSDPHDSGCSLQLSVDKIRLEDFCDLNLVSINVLLWR